MLEKVGRFSTPHSSARMRPAGMSDSLTACLGHFLAAGLGRVRWIEVLTARSEE